MASILMDLYEAVRAASARMLAAARADDWDGLVAAEADCARLVERLRAAGDARLEAGQLRRKSEILRAVLADDAEIRDRIQPWMARLETLISGTGRGRRMQSEYLG